MRDRERSARWRGFFFFLLQTLQEERDPFTRIPFKRTHNYYTLSYRSEVHGRSQVRQCFPKVAFPAQETLPFARAPALVEHVHQGVEGPGVLLVRASRGVRQVLCLARHRVTQSTGLREGLGSAKICWLDQEGERCGLIGVVFTKRQRVLGQRRKYLRRLTYHGMHAEDLSIAKDRRVPERPHASDRFESSVPVAKRQMRVVRAPSMSIAYPSVVESTDRLGLVRSKRTGGRGAGSGGLAWAGEREIFRQFHRCRTLGRY